MMALTCLFQPIKIGSLTLPNRIVMPAITTNYEPEQHARFLVERAKGGVGLIVIGALQTLFPGRRTGADKVNIYDDRDLPTLRMWTGAVHGAGTKVAAQLATYGYWAKTLTSTAEDIGPSAVELPLVGIHPAYAKADFHPKVRALGIDEIRTIEERIGDAAVRARDAGFDAIELQIVGGNLLHRFVNAYTNQRTDEYGGSLEGRCRILLRTIANIRSKVGDVPLICRIPGVDMVPWAGPQEEWIAVARMLEAAGADAFSIYPGWHETRDPRQQMSVPRGAFVSVAEGIKKAVGVPVAANIRINDAAYADRIIADGRVDMVAMATPLIADADLPNKARDGRLDDIRMCTACCNCWDDYRLGQPITCSVNALVSQEGVVPIEAAPVAKRVFVIGGGPAGMEAARVAATRGHRVTLFEKRDMLGGQLLNATRPPHKEEWRTFLDYLDVQLKKLGVEVRLRADCTAESIRHDRPDAVIVATGATPIVPPIPGAKSPNVRTAVDVLAGGKVSGQRIVIVGGGSVGCEAAEFLADLGKDVTILEMTDQVAVDLGQQNRWVLVDRLDASKIRVETRAKATNITEHGVQILRSGQYKEFFEADMVVIAAGMRADRSLAASLEGTVTSLYEAGDCTAVGRVRTAVAAGFEAGRVV